MRTTQPCQQRPVKDPSRPAAGRLQRRARKRRPHPPLATRALLAPARRAAILFSPCPARPRPRRAEKGG
eukprot:364320-Chlamydomonas_euryale.AAC.11